MGWESDGVLRMKSLYAGSECGKGDSSVCDKAECRDWSQASDRWCVCRLARLSPCSAE